MPDFNNEPTLEKIEDYDNKESDEKRSTIKKVVVVLLVVGVIFAALRYNFSNVEEYVGTPDNPGINTTKGY